MAVPSSGQLRLYADIQNEFGGAQANTSLHGMSVEAGFSTPDAMSDFYGYVDAVLPTVTTGGAGAGDVSMTVYGSNTDGGGTITERGFYFGTSTNRASNPKYTVTAGAGNFNRGFSGLTQLTTYYYWAYATNEVGTVFGARGTKATVQTFVPVYANTMGQNDVDFYDYTQDGGGDELGTDVTRQVRYYWQNPYSGGTNTGASINRNPGQPNFIGEFPQANQAVSNTGVYTQVTLNWPSYTKDPVAYPAQVQNTGIWYGSRWSGPGNGAQFCNCTITSNDPYSVTGNQGYALVNFGTSNYTLRYQSLQTDHATGGWGNFSPGRGNLEARWTMCG